MTDENQGQIASYLADHPRLMGALFTLMVVLTKAGTVAANHGGTAEGP